MYYHFNTFKDCACNQAGVEGGDIGCNEQGNCTCKNGFIGQKCNIGKRNYE